MPLESHMLEEVATPEDADRTELWVRTELETQELLVTIKSPILKAFFEQRAVDRANLPGVGQIFVPRGVPTIAGVAFDSPDGPLLLESGEINMTMLRAVDLDKGVTLTERGLPLTMDFVTAVRDAIEACLRILYSEYLRPIKMGAVLEFKKT